MTAILWALYGLAAAIAGIALAVLGACFEAATKKKREPPRRRPPRQVYMTDAELQRYLEQAFGWKQR